jgi:hypothetical protein
MVTQQWLKHLSVATGLTNRLSVSIALTALLITLSAGSPLAGNSVSTIVEFGVSEISELDVTGALSRPVTLTAPTLGVENSNNVGETYIRYTSVVSEGITRTISAAITSGSIPRGCRLRLDVTGLSGNGQFGNAVPDGIFLSGSSQDIVTGIGNCWTGTSDNDGVRLMYSLEVEDASSLVTDESTTVTVLFTIN